MTATVFVVSVVRSSAVSCYIVLTVLELGRTNIIQDGLLCASSFLKTSKYKMLLNGHLGARSFMRKTKPRLRIFFGFVVEVISK